MKEKIYFLINSMESWGAERVISSLIDELSHDYDIYLLTLKSSTFFHIPSSVRHIPLSRTKNNFIMLLLLPYYIIKLRKILASEKLKHGVSFLELSNFIHILSTKNANISLRTNLSYFKWFFWTLYLLLIRLLYPLSAQIIVNSEENKQDLINSLKIPVNKIHVILNPISRNINNEIAKEDVQKHSLMTSLIKPELKIFISIWRLDKIKNVSAQVSAFHKTKSKDFLLFIVGDWPEYQAINKQILEYNLANNIFMLWKLKNVFPFIKLANFFIFSSISEWFPNVLIEALSQNKPVITSDFKSWAREIINPSLGFGSTIRYPHFGPNWVILSMTNFDNDFAKLYPSISNIKPPTSNLDKFEIWNICNKWKKTLHCQS